MVEVKAKALCSQHEPGLRVESFLLLPLSVSIVSITVTLEERVPCV